MGQYNEIAVKSLSDNIFQLLDDDWMLITAGKLSSFNTMTASWGSFGILWQKPTATIVIRPQRYTLQFVNENDIFTLSFFAPGHKHILNFCGQHSGKNIDKVKETGLVPIELPSGNISFSQARMVMECKKLYVDTIKPENFIQKDIAKRIYPLNDFHHLFIAEILHCYEITENFQ